MDTVFQLIVKEEGLFSFSLIANEVDYYYNNLGLPNAYFDLFTPSEIAKHIHTFIASKKVAEIGAMGEHIKLSIEKKDSAFYLCTEPTYSEVRAEVRNHINDTPTEDSLGVSYMRSNGTIFHGGTQKLKLI